MTLPAYATTSPARMLADADRLLSIVAAARALGIEITSRTALRWAISGRHGLRLASVRVAGARRTTIAELRRWLAEVAEAEDRARGRVAPPAVMDDKAAEAILAARGLGRKGQK